MLVLAGLLMATSAVTARGTDLRSERRTDLADLVRAQLARAATAQSAVQQLRDDVDRLTAAAGRPGRAGGGWPGARATRWPPRSA